MRPTRVLCLPLLCTAKAAAPDARVCRETACEVAAVGDDAVHEVSLLSVRHRILASEEPANETPANKTPAMAAMDAESQRERLEAAKPIAWLHVPQAGSSLGNFMSRLPSLCPGIEEDLEIRNSTTMGHFPNRFFKTRYDPLSETGICPGSFSRWGNLRGAGPTWDEQYEGHCFVMLRQPEQRTLSGYNYGQFCWPESLPASNELQYAERIQGCAVRMITRGGGPKAKQTCGGQYTGLPTWDEVALAIHRIRTGCAFVGITDQWPLSMCLGHRIFGGKCRVTDFVDGRMTTKGGGETTKIAPDPHLYDLKPLSNFTDPYDGALYQAALEVFQENLLRYNVSMEACQPCFEEAGVDFSD